MTKIKENLSLISTWTDGKIKVAP